MLCNFHYRVTNFGFALQMATRNARRGVVSHTGTNSDAQGSSDDLINAGDSAALGEGVAPVASTSKQGADAYKLMEERVMALESQLEDTLDYTDSALDPLIDQLSFGESDWDSRVGTASPVASPQLPKQTKKKVKVKSKKTTNKRDPVESDGDQYTQNKKKAVKRHKVTKHRSKKHKYRKVSSSSDSSSSSEEESDSDNNHTGVMATECTVASQDREVQPDSKIRVCSLMKKSLQGQFHTFKPLEVIVKGAEHFTGVKGVESSFPREMDIDVNIPEDKKKQENILFAIQRGLLAGLVAIVPVANRILVEDKFTSLAKDLNAGLGLLAATSTYIQYRRYENIFKSVTTEAGKEVTRSKKVKDKNGKEFTVFLAPKPIKGKPYNRKLLFGGQLSLLLKQVESGNKCGKQMGSARMQTQQGNTRGRRFRLDSFRRRGNFRGGRAQFGNYRGRGRGWTENNRAVQSFRQPGAAAGKPLGFQRGGMK